MKAAAAGQRSSRLSGADDGQPKDKPTAVCKVCLSAYDDGPRHKPLVLSCRHTFCSGCIGDTLLTPEDRTKVFCPLCKSKTSLGKNGINGLPVNGTFIQAVRGPEKQSWKDVLKLTKVKGKDTSVQPAVQTGSNGSEPVKLKGILKVAPKQDRASINVTREPFSRIENGHASTGATGACRECPHCTANGYLENKREEHKVEARSTTPLHPPPNAFVGLAQHAPLNHHQQHQQQDKDDGKKPIEIKPLHPPPNAFVVLAQHDLLNQQQQQHDGIKPIEIKEVQRSAEDSDFSRDIRHDHRQMAADVSWTLSAGQLDTAPLKLFPSKTETISSDLTPDPFQNEDRNGIGSDLTATSGKLHPIGALLYMASATDSSVSRKAVENIVVTADQEASNSASPESFEVAELTESQQNLSSSAKYIGKFGKYNENSKQVLPETLISPQKIASSIAGDRLAIADSANSTVHLFSVKGEHVASFSAANLTGGICFLTDKDLAVATEKGVQIYQAPGTLKKTIPIGHVMAVARFNQGFVAAMRKRLSVCKAIAGSVVHSINGTRHPGLLQKLTPFDDVVDVAVSARNELCILERNRVLVTDEEGVIVYVVQPNVDSVCGPIGNAVALAIYDFDETASDASSSSGSGIVGGNGRSSGGIAVADGAHRRIILFGTDGLFQRCLVNMNEGSEDGNQRSGNINGIAVSHRAKSLYVVMTGPQLAEVRVHAI